MNKYVVLKLFGVLIAAFSQILLKKSADMLYEKKIYEYFNRYVFVGYIMFGISTVLSIFSLKAISISLSSIIESISYIAIPLLSFLFLKEKINKTYFIGTVIIVVGIIAFNINI